MTTKTYRTSPAFFALDDDTRYALVQQSAGNAFAELYRDEYGFIEVARVDHGADVLTLVVAWDINRNGYSVEQSFAKETN